MDSLLLETSRFLATQAPQGPYVVAVSGGRDSMALLAALVRLLPHPQIIVAHFDHRTRQGASHDDAEFVRNTAEKLGLAYVVGHASQGRDDEARLRAARWEFLERVRVEAAAGWIVTAHHAEDQWETSLERLLRGTGVHGLAAMRAVQGVRLRPWLHVVPSVIARFVAENAIAYREDASNAETRYFRNALRHDVAPGLRTAAERYGGYDRFLERFAHLTEDLAHAAEAMESNALTAALPHLVSTPFFDRAATAPWPLSLATATHAMTAWARRRGVPLLRAHAQQAGEFLLDARAEQLEVSGQLLLVRSSGHVYLAAGSQRAAAARWREDIGAGVALVSGAARFPSPAPWSFRCDESDGARLVARLAAPGDRFRGRRLTRWLREHDLPAPERAFLPTLARGSEVVWFLGMNGASPTLQADVDFPFALQR